MAKLRSLGSGQHLMTSELLHIYMHYLHAWKRRTYVATDLLLFEAKRVTVLLQHLFAEEIFQYWIIGLKGDEEVHSGLSWLKGSWKSFNFLSLEYGIY